MKSRWWWAIPVALLPALSGCSGKHLFAANDARTELDTNPLTGSVSFYDSKDNQVTVKNLVATSGDRSLKVEELTIDNSASKAMLAEVEKLKVTAAAQVELTKEVMRSLDNLAAEVRRTLNPVSGVVDSVGDALPKAGEGYRTATSQSTEAKNARSTSAPAPPADAHAPAGPPFDEAGDD